ncbi:MAG: hypothetical protein IKN64_04905 [Desulfovibrio sp.]|nr:hypothetical protein [Desulfovibrio sp.]
MPQARLTQDSASQAELTVLLALFLQIRLKTQAGARPWMRWTGKLVRKTTDLNRPLNRTAQPEDGKTRHCRLSIFPCAEGIST